MKYAAFLGIGAVVVVLVVGIAVWSAMRPAQAPVATPTVVPQQESVPSSVPVSPAPIVVSSPSFQPQQFTQTKTAHFVSSEPVNNAALTAAPISVKISFNFDLVSPSEITVMRDNKDVTSGQTTIAADKLSMGVPITANQTGNYRVTYTACWPDKSCHNGSFGFSVNVTP